MANTGRTFELLRKHGVTRAAWHPDGKLASVEFGPPAPEEPKQTAAQREAAKPKYVPGTTIPDDRTPLNPLDTLLNPPKYDPSEVDA